MFIFAKFFSEPLTSVIQDSFELCSSNYTVI